VLRNPPILRDPPSRVRRTPSTLGPTSPGCGEPGLQSRVVDTSPPLSCRALEIPPAASVRACLKILPDRGGFPGQPAPRKLHYLIGTYSTPIRRPGSGLGICNWSYASSYSPVVSRLGLAGDHAVVHSVAAACPAFSDPPVAENRGSSPGLWTRRRR